MKGLKREHAVGLVVEILFGLMICGMIVFWEKENVKENQGSTTVEYNVAGEAQEEKVPEMSVGHAISVEVVDGYTIYREDGVITEIVYGEDFK